MMNTLQPQNPSSHLKSSLVMREGRRLLPVGREGGREGGALLCVLSEGAVTTLLTAEGRRTL